MTAVSLRRQNGEAGFGGDGMKSVGAHRLEGIDGKTANVLGHFYG